MIKSMKKTNFNYAKTNIVVMLMGCKIINLRLRDINPFIRFVNIKKYVPVEYLLCAVDYHFYYLFTDCVIQIAGNEYSLKSGGVIIVPPGTEYQFKTDEMIEILSVNFDFTQNNTGLTEGISPVFSRTFSESQIIEKVNFTDNTFLNSPIISAGNSSYILEQLKEIIDEYNFKRQYFSETASCIFKMVILTVAKNIVSGENSDNDIDLVLSYIHSHYKEYIDNSLLAEMVGYHPYHLNRLMKKITGTTLRQYIIEYRIEAAKRYLGETDYRISKIAELCGYKNFTNFSRDFKNKCGMTPGHFREKVRHIL